MPAERRVDTSAGILFDVVNNYWGGRDVADRKSIRAGIMKACAVLPGIPEETAARAGGYRPRATAESARVDELDAIQFKYIPAPLTAAQKADFLRLPAIDKGRQE